MNTSRICRIAADIPDAVHVARQVLGRHQYLADAVEREKVRIVESRMNEVDHCPGGKASSPS